MNEVNGEMQKIREKQSKRGVDGERVSLRSGGKLTSTVPCKAPADRATNRNTLPTPLTHFRYSGVVAQSLC